MKQRQNNLLPFALSLLLGTVGYKTSQAMENPSSIDLENITSTSLILEGKQIGDAGAQTLAKNTTLTSLDLRNNGIGDAGAQALAKNTTLSSLNLRQNWMGTAGVKALAQNTTLTSLDLRNNRVGDSGAQALAKNTTLTSLNLECCWIGVEGVAALLNALRTQTNLTELSLKWPNSNNEREVEFLLNRNKELASNRTHQVIPTVPAPTPQPMQGTFPQNVIAPVLPDEPSKTKEDKGKEKLGEFIKSLINKDLRDTALRKKTITPSQRPNRLLDSSQAKIKQLEKEKAQVEENLSSVMLANEHLLERQSTLASSYQSVFELLQEMPQQASPLVQMALGLSYKLELVPDPHLALQWFGKALGQGESRALDFIREDADKGEKEAQYLVARAYEQGQGIPRDLRQAATWYNKAAEQQHPLARQRLAALQSVELEIAAQEGDETI
ncbi:SEL1-like repeat protein [Candidatus Odyssella acanthamoebae]|uniref:Sel1 repeat family protein n=1 Tax=Candidatus Odyssella acanthamoebae TaxID=91604 RepID=A0A077AXD0_9PROT|nr:SEL1-like repeat protein [Candidatus Paracaedibacter acanthamoebae]AIK96288.1 hypothetical protein ID47_05360 [Candidatus Paracaedibacter acanthamoebae]